MHVLISKNKAIDIWRRRARWVRAVRREYGGEEVPDGEQLTSTKPESPGVLFEIITLLVP